MFKALRRVYDWAALKVHSKHADTWFFILFLSEAVLFLPADPLLILFCTQRKDRAFKYAFLATLASVIMGIAGYLIGFFAWETLGPWVLKWVIKPETFHSIVEQFTKYQYWLLIIGSFVPMPYKALTLSAGFCQIPVVPFIICSIIGRGARFFLVAGAIRIWGAQISRFIDQYFNQLIIFFVSLILVIVWYVKR